jgi:3-phosphoshikimate 1-carboxyvinyltransferase
MIDEFPAFAAAAACAEGPSVVSGAEELRYKESDRISALCNELRAVGVAAQETPDGFILPGSGGPTGGGVDPHGDHRLAMALAVAGLASSAPLTVRDAQITSESFPGFAGVLRSLGARLETA